MQVGLMKVWEFLQLKVSKFTLRVANQIWMELLHTLNLGEPKRTFEILGKVITKINFPSLQR